MRRYWVMLGGMLLVFLALFGVATALGIPILSDPSPWMGRGDAVAAGVGVGLLAADVFLPVPSSAVMLAHGALFGVWTGALLSIVGSLGAAAVGFGVGWAGNDV